MPKGHRNIPLPPPLPVFEPKQLAETMATAVISGKGILKKQPGLGEVTEQDLKAIKRLTGESAEFFNAMLSQELGSIAKDTLAVIKRKLADDEFKTSELAFLFSVMHDKRMSMDGRSQVANAAINVQINQYGTQVSKSDLILMLEGRKPVADLPGGQVVEVEKVG